MNAKYPPPALCLNLAAGVVTAAWSGLQALAAARP